MDPIAALKALELIGVVVAVLWLVYTLRKGAKAEVRAATAEAQTKVDERISNAGANAPGNSAALARELRDGANRL